MNAEKITLIGGNALKKVSEFIKRSIENKTLTREESIRVIASIALSLIINLHKQSPATCKNLLDDIKKKITSREQEDKKQST